MIQEEHCFFGTNQHSKQKKSKYFILSNVKGITNHDKRRYYRYRN